MVPTVAEYEDFKTSVLLHTHMRMSAVQISMGARGSVFGWGTILQAGTSPVRVPDGVDFFQFT
jgi:hypothetical protein